MSPFSSSKNVTVSDQDVKSLTSKENHAQVTLCHTIMETLNLQSDNHEFINGFIYLFRDETVSVTRGSGSLRYVTSSLG